MALPTSGPMSLISLQTEYGGANPVGLMEYYRNGLYVPSTISTTTVVPAGSWSSYVYTVTPITRWVLNFSGGGYWVVVHWGGSQVAYSSDSAQNATQLDNFGGYDYGRGNLYSYTPGSKNDPISTWHYYVRRRTTATTTTTTVNVNTNVPEAPGTLYLAASFYGGRKT